MSVMCKTPQSFQVVRVLGSGDFGTVLEVRCIEPGHLWPDKRYAMKVCFNFDMSTTQARGKLVNEFLELVRLPGHPNVIRFLCEFFDEIDDSIRLHLPPFAREQSVIRDRSGSRNRKTQFFVLELVSMTLERFLNERYAAPATVPERVVRMIMSQVCSGLMHLERNHIAHRDIKPNNILVEINPRHRAADAMSHPISRCVITDFGTACKLSPDLKSTTVVGLGGAVISSSLWGNPHHIAPELHSTLGAAMNAQRSAREACGVELDYSKQAVFELGVLGFEIVNGSGPIDGYPESVANRTTRTVRYDDSHIAEIPRDRLRADLGAMLRTMVSFDARQRPSLGDVLALFDPEGEFSSTI